MSRSFSRRIAHHLTLLTLIFVVAVAVAFSLPLRHTSAVRAGATIASETKLTASDAAANDNFGQSVAISGDTAVVGAPNDDTSAGMNTGSAYVLVRSSNGQWSQQAKLTASDAATNDQFGGSVAISGDTIVVGAVGADTPPVFANFGSVYVYVRSNGQWNQQAKLLGLVPPEGINDIFPSSLAISGDTIVAGASRADTQIGGTDAGAAFVYVRNNGQWSGQGTLTASDAAIEDGLGESVAISGDTIVVGATGEGAAPGEDFGSAYVFVRSSGQWSQQAKLAASDKAKGDDFGYSVSASGDTIVVGSPRDNLTFFVTFPNSTAISNTKVIKDAGSAYVFVRSNGQWSQQKKLTASNAAKDDEFGSSVAISGDTAVVGAPSDDLIFMLKPPISIVKPTSRAIFMLKPPSSMVKPNTKVVIDAGSAFVYVRSNGQWSQQVKHTADDAAKFATFGHSVSISDDTIVAGAPNANTGAGSIYIYAP